MIDTEETVACQWVAGQYEGDAAKRVKAHVGVSGYLMLKEGKGWILAAFRRPLRDGPLPHHLVAITDPKQIEKLEQRRTGYTPPPKPQKSQAELLTAIFERKEEK